jgi:hypothetical protein
VPLCRFKRTKSEEISASTLKEAKIVYDGGNGKRQKRERYTFLDQNVIFNNSVHRRSSEPFSGFQIRLQSGVERHLAFIFSPSRKCIKLDITDESLFILICV